MLHYLRWAVRRPRVWVTVVAMVLAPLLTVGDGRAGWTAIVVAFVALLGGASLREAYEAEHPEVEDRRAAKQQEAVDKILWRYERECAARERERG